MIALLSLLFSAVLLQDPATDPVSGSEAWYEQELAWLEESRDDPGLWDLRRYEHIPWYLSLPENAAARPVLSVERRVELYRRLIALAHGSVHLDAQADTLERWLASLLGETGDREAELEQWRHAAAVANDPLSRSWAQIPLAQILSRRWHWDEALQVLDEADRDLTEALAGDLSPVERGELVDQRHWLLHERAIVLQALGSLSEAAADLEELWVGANERLEEVAAASEDGYPEPGENAAAMSWWRAAQARLMIPLAQRRRLDRVPRLFAEITEHPMFQEKLGERGQARLLLRLGMAEVEGRRTGVLPAATPVETLREVVEVLPLDPEVDPLFGVEEALLARLWLARALLDEGRAGPAGELLAELRGALEELAPDLLRPRLMLAALEAAHWRADPTAPLEPVLERMRAAYAVFLDRWDRTPQMTAGVGFLHLEEWSSFGSELIQLLARPEAGEAGVREALAEVVRAQARGSLARRLGAGEPDLERLRAELLRPGEGWLLYFYGRERTHLFLVDAERVRHVALGSDHALDAARGELVAAVERAVEEGSEAALAALRQPLERAAAFFLPAEAREAIEGWRSLAVVGLDGIGAFPFDLLPWADGVELGRAFPLRWLPSLPVAWELHRREQAGEGTVDTELALFAAPDAGVPEALAARYRLEAEDLARWTRAYGRERCSVVAGPAATAEGLAVVDGARVAHLVVHGEHDPLHSLPGLRVWGPDGPRALYAGELADLRFPSLTILSVCGAGRAPLRRGDDGAAHLGGVALAGGASTVLLSTVAIGLEPSLDLFERFHARLAESGEAPAEALRAAREDLAPGATELERLHHHLVHLVGLGDRPLYEARPPSDAGSRRTGWAVGLVALVALAVVGVAVALARRG